MCENIRVPPPPPGLQTGPVLFKKTGIELYWEYIYLQTMQETNAQLKKKDW